MADLDRLLRSDISHPAQDAAEPPDFAVIESRGVRLRRTRTVIVTAAVTALVAVIGGLQLEGVRHVVPASPPSTMTVVSTPRSMPSGETAIDPGTFRVARSIWSAAEYTVSFPAAGWRVSDGNRFARHIREKNEFGYQTTVVHDIYADACRGDTGAVKPVAPSSADLVSALLTQPGTDATGPIATTLGGRPATRVDLRVPKGLDVAACSLKGLGLQIWYSAPVDDYFVLLPDGTASVYVLDVEGKRAVFITQYRAGATAAERAELQTVLDSIRFP